MKNQFMCVTKSHNGLFNVSYNSARDLLLNYLNRRGIGYYCSGKGGSCIELYFRLRSTGIRIKQSIYIKALTYHCSTKIIENPVCSIEERLKLLSRLDRINGNLPRGRFTYTSADGQLVFTDSLTLHPKNGVLNIQNISEGFEQLIYQPHYLLDIEHPDIVLSAFKIKT